MLPHDQIPYFLRGLGVLKQIQIGRTDESLIHQQLPVDEPTLERPADEDDGEPRRNCITGSIAERPESKLGRIDMKRERIMLDHPFLVAFYLKRIEADAAPGLHDFRGVERNDES